MGVPQHELIEEGATYCDRTGIKHLRWKNNELSPCCLITSLKQHNIKRFIPYVVFFHVRTFTMSVGFSAFLMHLQNHPHLAFLKFIPCDGLSKCRNTAR